VESNNAGSSQSALHDRPDEFSIEMLPAGHGDCLLLRYGSGSRSCAVLIDGGPYHCYPALQRRMSAFPEGLQLVVVTHVDADHTEGIVKLLQDASVSLPIRDLWFNGWRHLQPGSGTLSPVTGEYLGACIESRMLPWNLAFRGEAVATDPQLFPVIELEGGLRLTVFSPPRPALVRLRRIWERTLLQEGLAPGSSRDATTRMESSRRFGRHRTLEGFSLDEMAREEENSDDSVVNGSSIALLAEFEGNRVLLAGDSHPTVLERGIRAWLASRQFNKLRLNAFKLSHHGSEKSLTNSLLRLLDCRNYLISTNGSYFGHPDDRAIARVIRHGGPRVALHFNYRQTMNRFWDDSELRKRENFQVFFPDDNDGLKVDLNNSPA
jgi:beta-lactamase superfamily II metal-dependent hydrolase